MISVSDIVEWIVLHRKNNAFKDYTQDKIALHLAECNKNDTLCIVTDGDTIVGVATAAYEVDGYMRIINIIATNKKALLRLMNYYIARWPNTPIIGRVRNRIRHFNSPEKLLRRLS